MTGDAHGGFERVDGAAPAPGELRAVRLTGGTAVCVGNASGTLFAVRDECPHAGFPLSEGSLLDGGVLECAWHGAHFDCLTGRSLDEPPFDPVQRFEVTAAGGEVWIRQRVETPGAGT